MYISSEFFAKRQVERINDPVMTDRRILISVTSPNTRGSKPAVLHPCWRDVLRLEFHDIDPNTRSRRKQKDLCFFTVDHAQRIIKFLEQHADAPETEIWVHCEAGISRSAAIAKFAAQVYSLEFPEAYSLYNRHIFSTLLSTYYKSLYPEAEH